MGLFSIFRRTDSPARMPAATESGDAVQQARTRARRRLIGAAVLLVIGVIGFPLVFETRPRPIPVDIPIEIPKKESAPALLMPPPRTAAAAPSGRSAPVPAEDIITESSSEAGRELTGPKLAASASAKPFGNADTRNADAAKVVAKPTGDSKASSESKVAARSAAEAKPTEAKAAPKPSTESKSAETRVAAKPAAEPKAASGTDASRFVVQVGAFAEASSAREARSKVEKLGLKTYTQVAETPAGSRIRVRVGPFANRAEADAALAKARAAGLTAVVLTL